MAERDFEDSGDKRLTECCRLSLSGPEDASPRHDAAGPNGPRV